MRSVYPKALFPAFMPQDGIATRIALEQDGDKNILYGNPGTDTCHKKIAENKGWKVHLESGD
ncbi:MULTISPECIES: hypothetical protein [Porphyromonas]|uniref:Uncharacterized protein n=1 Tax=Porphyromonas canoris TaxID=36875 RepID=A0ABR4XML0_9PORP|nr:MULTISPECIES: hypothetical protein [Porphyromonas]KGN67345.1 hypothetical protein JT26_08855 [Porphyromonas sp. COT-108 OH1349]KGN93355.1 hypothetical protein HQ43_01555 [Porphyromonas canoris]